MVTATDPAQCEAERLDESTEIGEADISQIARSEAVPKLLSPRTSHYAIIGCAIDYIDDKTAIMVCQAALATINDARGMTANSPKCGQTVCGYRAGT